MTEYRPWSSDVLNPIIQESNKKLPILDIQLGGACNLGCIYCDTPKYHSPCDVDLESIRQLTYDGDISWIYVCGLGEPTASQNLYHLKEQFPSFLLLRNKH